ncbi:MAG TPA: hypothetical protein VG795_06415 [Acidimicrobiia bacterium]|nr:hypothetical protein [Acidimicrobiia bacterium]
MTPGPTKRAAVTVVAATALLASLVSGTAPASAVAYPGINGKLVCGGTLPTPTPNVSDFEVYSMNPDGSERTNLTDENPITDYNPIWTPDGLQILYEAEFVGQAVDDTFELILMNPDGSGKTPLLINGRPEDIPKGYHPDGSQISFSSNRDGNSEIYKMWADATEQTRLTNNPANDAWPRWSPDGTRIVFQSSRRANNNDIWVMDSFGGNLVNLTPDNPAADSTPEWSPDGTKIVFTRNLGGAAGNEVFVMNADGSNQVNISNNSRFPAQGFNYDAIPSWSPDGTKIAFTSTRDTGDFEVYTMNVDGSGVTRITFASGFDGRCDWQRICTITGAGRIQGTPGDDVICGSPSNDQIVGLGGNDVISGFGGNDLITGGEGNDTIFGGFGNDSITGGEGSDFPSGGPGNDRIVATPGERVDPGAGADVCVIRGVSTVCPPRLS